MKYCPRCNERYKDENLNFCLNDGELLNEMSGEDAPPTAFLDPTRVTNEGNWNDQNTNFSDFNSPNQQIYQQPFSSPAPMAMVGQDKTLSIVSLVLGGLSVFCCYIAIITGPAAIITGFLGMNKVKSQPELYGGKEMAIIGMILGGIGFIISVLYFIFVVLGSVL